MQREGQGRFDRAERQAREDARVADAGEHQILVADAAQGAEDFDGFEHVVQVVGGLAHAHEHDPLHRAAGPGQDHLGQYLAAFELAQQAALAGHAEGAAHGAAELGGDADAVPGQQHAFHVLAVGETYQQTGRVVLAWMFGLDGGQSVQLAGQFGQGFPYPEGQEAGGGLVPGTTL